MQVNTLKTFNTDLGTSYLWMEASTKVCLCKARKMVLALKPGNRVH